MKGDDYITNMLQYLSEKKFPKRAKDELDAADLKYYVYSEMFLFQILAMLEFFFSVAEISPVFHKIFKSVANKDKISKLIGIAAEGESKLQILTQKIF